MQKVWPEAREELSANRFTGKDGRTGPWLWTYRVPQESSALWSFGSGPYVPHGTRILEYFLIARGPLDSDRMIAHRGFYVKQSCLWRDRSVTILAEIGTMLGFLLRFLLPLTATKPVTGKVSESHSILATRCACSISGSTLTSMPRS